MSKKIFLSLLIVLNVLFLIYWSILSANYCLHFDDAHFMWKMKEYSLFEYVAEMYNSRGGNFVGYGLNWIIFSISNILGYYRFWPMFFYAVGIFFTFICAVWIFNGVKKCELLLGVVAFYNLYILTVPDYAVFTWLCAMSYFLFAPSICLYLRIVNMKRLNVFNWTILCLLTLFLSGSNISITPMMWLMLLGNTLYISWKKEKRLKITFNEIITKRILLLCLISIVVYVIMFIAPGNFNRLETGDDMCHPDSLEDFGFAWMKCIFMFFYMSSFYSPYHALIFVFGLILGYKFDIEAKYNIRHVIVAIIAFLIYIGIAVIPLAYLSNGFGIQRNYTHIMFFYLLTIFIIGLILSQTIKQSDKHYVIGCVISLFLIVIMSINLLTDTPKVVAYSEAHKERESMLLKLKGENNKNIVEVEKFPSTATMDSKFFVQSLVSKPKTMQHVYYESDTGTEPNEYESHIKKLLSLDFDFVLKDE